MATSNSITRPERLWLTLTGLLLLVWFFTPVPWWIVTAHGLAGMLVWLRAVGVISRGQLSE